MVSFTCEVCQEVVKKNKVDKHCESACSNAWNFTCIDCNKTFGGYDYQAHNSCVTEEEKYWGQYATTAKTGNSSERRPETAPSRTKTTKEANPVVRADNDERCVDDVETMAEVGGSNMWAREVVEVLQQCPGSKMKWRKLAEKVVANVKAKRKDLTAGVPHADLVAQCLSSIPADMLSEEDSYVRLQYNK